MFLQVLESIADIEPELWVGHVGFFFKCHQNSVLNPYYWLICYILKKWQKIGPIAKWKGPTCIVVLYCFPNCYHFILPGRRCWWVDVVVTIQWLMNNWKTCSIPLTLITTEPGPSKNSSPEWNPIRNLFGFWNWSEMVLAGTIPHDIFSTHFLNSLHIFSCNIYASLKETTLPNWPKSY